MQPRLRGIAFNYVEFDLIKIYFPAFHLNAGK